MWCVRRRRRRLCLSQGQRHLQQALAGRRILLISPPNSYRIAPFLEAAARLGLEPWVASAGEHSLVPALAQGLHVDLGDPAAALGSLRRAVRRWPVDGVVGTDDATVALAARLAQSLGLVHNPPHAARFSRRKDLARVCLAEAGVPVPAARPVDLEAPWAPQLRGLPFPCVVKPLSLSGSRGVIRADDLTALRAALARVGQIVGAEKELEPEARRYVLVEAFVPGPEVALEGMLHGGELEVLALFDKPDPLDGPYFEETYYVTPSRHPARLQKRITARVRDACAAYDLREGPVHAEVRLYEDEAWIMEVAARTIGGQCARLLRFGTGYGVEELVLAQAVGHPLSVQLPGEAAGVLMIPIPRAGMLRRVEGVLDARRVPFTEDLEISVREGYELVPLPEGASYLGFIFARAPTPEQVERALREAHSTLNIVTAPVLPVR